MKAAAASHTTIPISSSDPRTAATPGAIPTPVPAFLVRALRPWDISPACLPTAVGYWRHEGWGEPGAYNGVVHYVYAQHGAGSDPGDVYYIRSADRGQTFSAPLKLNTEATSRPQWQPNPSVSPRRTVLAVWECGRERG